jgi:hypothetical protein
MHRHAGKVRQDGKTGEMEGGGASKNGRALGKTHPRTPAPTKEL